LSDLERQLEIQRALLRDLENDLLFQYEWSPAVRSFMNDTARFKLISGGNQLGKTTIITALTTMHIEGRYPDWYKGPRFDKPVRWAIAGPTAAATRDNLTDDLLGPKDDRGSGMLRESAIGDIRYTTGDMIDTFQVKHESGGWSRIKCFSYDQGARRLQGRTLEGVTFDESPKIPVVEELQQRLNATRGFLIGACSPKDEDGIELLEFFEQGAPLRTLHYYGLDDALWMPADQREELKILNANNPLRDATLYGKPIGAAGSVFTCPVADFEYDPRSVSGRSIIGIDLPHSTGFFAAVRLVEEDGTWHAVQEYQAEKLTLAEHASALADMGGELIPIAWPHDGGRVAGDGFTIAEDLRQRGLQLLPKHASMVGVDGKEHRSVVTIIDIVNDMLHAGTLKISKDCPGLSNQLARFRWRKGHVGQKPPRQNDHIVDGLLKAVMMLDYAQDPRRPFEKLTPDNSGIAHFVSRQYNPLAKKAWRPRW
jgi:phage terminase large subunit-like protein